MSTQNGNQKNVIIILGVIVMAGMLGAFYMGSVLTKPTIMEPTPQPVNVTDPTNTPQMRTAVEITSIQFLANNIITVNIRNRGGYDANVTISIRLNKAGTTYQTISLGKNNIVPIGESKIFSLSYTWVSKTNYVIRATTSTGFYYESPKIAP